MLAGDVTSSPDLHKAVEIVVARPNLMRTTKPSTYMSIVLPAG
jgi:hypothetical protein